MLLSLTEFLLLLSLTGFLLLLSLTEFLLLTFATLACLQVVGNGLWSGTAPAPWTTLRRTVLTPSPFRGFLTRLGRVGGRFQFLDPEPLLFRNFAAGRLDGVGYRGANQAHRPDRIVVPRNRIIDQVRIRVGIRDGNDRNSQSVRFPDRDDLTLGVHHKNRTGEAAHVLHAREIFVEPKALSLKEKALLLRVELEGVLLLAPFQLL